MGIVPEGRLSDSDVAAALGRAVTLAGLILDVLSEFDPIGLRERTFRLDEGDGAVDKVLDTAASALNWADVPGTQAWEAKDRTARINWWIRRVGALDTVAVAWPGALGALASRLPIQDALGFAGQTLILCAVAREYGLNGRTDQARLLAAVLCGRDIPDPPPTDDGEPWPDSLVKKLWHLAGILNAVGDELAKRPHPRKIFRYLGMLPAVGAIAAYLGEFGALHRAAKAGEKWINRTSR